MNKIYFATNPYSLVAAVDRDWLLASFQDLGDKNQDKDARYLNLLGNWGGESVLGYDPSNGRFEPATPDSDFGLFLVNDDCDNPLEGFDIDKGDFLVYHDRTVNASIKGRFSPDKSKSSHHLKDPAQSDYNQAYSILSDDGDDKIRRVLNAIFPSREQMKKTISQFVARLYHKDLPPLPKELASLAGRYKKFGALSPTEKSAFVDDCIKIMDGQ